MHLTFWGAAATVTGSAHLVEADGQRYLLDFGTYQGRRKDAEARNRDLPVPAGSVSAVVLSHAHIDHSGNLPYLVKRGFNGPIYTTPATIDLCGAMLLDQRTFQEKDAEFLNKRRNHHGKGGNNGPVEPLYTMEDAERVMPLFRPVPYYQTQAIGENLDYECLRRRAYAGVVFHRAAPSGERQGDPAGILGGRREGRTRRSFAIPTRCRRSTI